MTIKIQPNHHNFDMLALQKCTLEALEWSEFKMADTFPCVTYDALKESVYIRYKAAMQLTTQDILENDKFAPNFNLALKILLRDLIKRHVIKSLGNNLLKAQFRLFKPASTPVDVLTKKQMSFIYDYARKTIDTAQSGYVDDTVVYASTLIHTTIMSENDLIGLMDLCAKIKL
jgi:hypothetical protein